MKLYRLAPAGTKIGLSELFSSLLKGLLASQENPLRCTISNRLNVKSTFCISQGRAALTVMLEILARRTGRKTVIIPSYTCFTVPAAVVRSGCNIKIIDINPVTLDFDRKLLEITDYSDVLAIVPSNLYGIPNDLDYLEALAKGKGVYLIDDSAQAFGAKFNGRYTGTFGHAGLYSLSKGKSFTTLEGGIIVTNEEALATEIEEYIQNLPIQPYINSVVDIFRLTAYSVFLHPYLYWMPESLPFTGLGETVYTCDFSIRKYNSLLSHLGVLLLEKIEDLNQERRGKALFLKEGLIGHREISTIKEYDNADSIYVRYPILIRDEKVRESVFQELHREGLGVSKSYPVSINRIPGIQEHLVGETHCPQGELVARSILTLPTHTYVSPRDIERMLQILRRHCL